MSSSLRPAKIAVRFKPEERRRLLDSLGADRTGFNGLGMAVVERGWHVCWLSPKELDKLRRRVELKHVSLRVAPPSPLNQSDRTGTGSAEPNHEKQRRSRRAGLSLAGMALCREGEAFPLPLEIAHAAGFCQADFEEIRTASSLNPQYIENICGPEAAEPLPELGGLSPEAFAHLVNADWLNEQGIFSLRQDLSPAFLDNIAPLGRAHLMLRALKAWGPLPADSLGRLPMGMVLYLLENPAWPGRNQLSDWSSEGIPTEDKATAVHATRTMLQSGGLLQRREGKYCLTSQGRSLLERDRQAELYTCLLEARFRRGAGFAPLAEKAAPRFHRAMAYHLYRLALCPHSAAPAQDLANWVSLPIWLYGLHPWSGSAALGRLFNERFIAPLEEFGLLARRKPPNSSQRAVYAITPLLARLLDFDA